MRNSFVAAGIVILALSQAGCGRRVPDRIVKDSLTSALRHATQTASVMCGGTTAGLITSTPSAIKIGEKNVGTAHIKGVPRAGKDMPSECEGDIEFAYSYTSKRINKRKSTTIWKLEHLKLLAVQTKGVALKPVDETMNDETDDN